MKIPSIDIPAIAELAARDQWVAWRREKRNGKGTKVPYQAVNGRRASSTDPKTWASFDAAKAACEKGGYDGIGYVLAESDPYVGVDLDDCLHDGRPDDRAIEIVKSLGSYTEISPSGRGLRIFVRGTIPKSFNRNGVEAYSQERFLTTTGEDWADSPTLEIRESNGPLAEFYAKSNGSERASKSGNGANSSRHRRLLRTGMAAMKKRRAAESWGDKTDDELEGIAKWGATRITADPDPLEDYTNSGMARRLLRLYGDRLAYAIGPGWHVWDGRRWLRDESRESLAVCELALDSADRCLVEVLNDPGAVASANRTRSDSAVRAAVRLAAARITRREAAELDADGELLTVLNGTLNLRSGVLGPHRREDWITKLAATEYNPNAQAPKFQAFLARCWPDPEVQHFLQVAIGSACTGMQGKEKLIILWGDGANGKTTLIRACQLALGDEYCRELPSEFLIQKRESDKMDRYKSELPGKRFVTAMEPAEGSRLNEAALKRITSNEPANGRYLFREGFNFIPECTPFVSTNHKPTVRSTDEGAWRRLALVPCTVQIPEAERDGQFRERVLDREREGIFAWMIRGAGEFLAIGWPALPEAVREATTQYKEESDPLTEFLEERCELGLHASVAAGDLLLAYREFAGVRAMSSGRFKARLLAREGVEWKRTQKLRIWVGIRLRNDG